MPAAPASPIKMVLGKGLRKKPRVFSRTYWKHLVERVDSRVRKRRSQERLDERISGLPLELRLQVLEQWICENPVKIGDYGVEHLLLDDKLQERPLKERLAVYRAAPVLREIVMSRADEACWLYGLETGMEDVSTFAEALPEFQSLIERHDGICGGQAKNQVRLQVRISLEGTCRLETRILCYGFADLVQQPSPEHHCPYPTCDFSSRKARIVRSLESYRCSLARTTQLPDEDISVEIRFDHECTADCLWRHPSYTVSSSVRAIAMTTMVIGNVGLYLLFIPIQSLALSFGSWQEFKEWHHSYIHDADWAAYCARVGLISLPITIGTLAFLPSSLALKWTWKVLQVLLAGAGKLCTGCAKVLRLFEHEACKIRRELNEASKLKTQ